MSNSTYTFGTSSTLTLNAFQNSEHSFGNWNTNLNDTGSSFTNGYSADEVYKVVRITSITLYAQWI